MVGVLVPGGAGVTQIHILLGILVREVYIMQCLVQMHGAQHAGVAIHNIKIVQITDIPVCKPFHHI
jgi:hypothetical protein